MAPEILLYEDEEQDERQGENEDDGAVGGPPFSKMSDVYAFSMLMFQVCTRLYPI
jgi:hypothetical protein